MQTDLAASGDRDAARTSVEDCCRASRVARTVNDDANVLVIAQPTTNSDAVVRAAARRGDAEECEWLSTFARLAVCVGWRKQTSFWLVTARRTRDPRSMRVHWTVRRAGAHCQM